MDDLAVVRRTIEEHHKVRGNIRLVGEAMNDMEALFGLLQAHTTWSQTSVAGLAEVIERMQRTIAGLSEGLRNHFGFEERYLPPVFGANLMKALLYDHNDIRHKLEGCAASMLDEMRGQTQERLLEYRTAVQQMVADLTTTIENHASREEVILGMLERALSKEKEEKEAKI